MVDWLDGNLIITCSSFSSLNQLLSEFIYHLDKAKIGELEYKCCSKDGQIKKLSFVSDVMGNSHAYSYAMISGVKGFFIEGVSNTIISSQQNRHVIHFDTVKKHYGVADTELIKALYDLAVKHKAYIKLNLLHKETKRYYAEHVFDGVKIMEKKSED